MVNENRELLSKIAGILLADYTRVYVVNTKTNGYCRYIVDQDSHFPVEEQAGDDFFDDLEEFIRQAVYEEDRHFFQTEELKENLLKQFLLC